MAARKKPTTKGATKEVVIPKIDVRTVTLGIVGDTPLVVHRFGAKARKEMLDKQTGKAKQKKAPRNPKDEYEDALYKLNGSGTGIPCACFKRAAANAFRMVEGLKKVEINAALHVLPDGVAADGTECVKIKGRHRMREDVVRLADASRTAMVRFRPEYPVWSCKLTIRYNHAMISPEQIANLFNNAGFGVGVCEHRPERGGSWGTFHVE